MAAPVMKSAGIPLMKAPGIPAHDVNCCCISCNYVNNPTPNVCTQCAATDDPNGVWSTPRNLKLTIAGVVGGSNTGCGTYPDWVGEGLPYATACEGTAVATNAAFFNGDYVYAPCGPGGTFTNCVDLGCQVNSTPYFLVVPFRVYELNKLTIGMGSFGGTVTLESWVVGDGRNCGTITYGSDYIEYSYRKRQFQFAYTVPTFQQWRYDPVLAPPENCADNIRIDYDGKCIAAGVAATLTSDTQSETTCKKAMNFSGATLNVVTV